MSNTMSLSNTTETAALDCFLRGTDPSYRTGATQYLALFTADPTDTADLTNKAKKSIWQKFLEGGASHAGSVIAGGLLVWMVAQVAK